MKPISPSRRLQGWVALGLWLLFGWAPGARAAEEPGAGGTFRGEGRCQFLTEQYELSAKTEEAINRVVEDAVRKHETVFGLQLPPTFRVRIRIFGRFADFEQYTRTNEHARGLIRNGQSLTNLGGYYAHGLRQIVTWRQQHAADLGNTLLHEASHAILHSAYRRVPIWLSEGSATYFAYPRHVQDDRDIGSLQYRWAKLLSDLRNGRLTRAETALNWTVSEWHALDPAVTYTVAWSLFQLTMSKPERQDVMRRYLHSLQTSRRRRSGGGEPPPEARPADSAALFASLWPGGMTQLEKDWHGWIRQGAARVLGPDLEEILKQVR